MKNTWEKKDLDGKSVEEKIKEIEFVNYPLDLNTRQPQNLYFPRS